MDTSFEALLAEWREEINTRLIQLMDGREPPLLYDPMHYVLDGSGKRIRPLLLLLSCKTLGGRLDVCWEAAVAVELLHNFTLVHDDIMDEDDTRRGRATVHKKWDSDVALLAGDGLVALSFYMLSKTPSPRLAQIAQIFTNGLLELCEGQALDIDFETRDVTTDEYLTMIRKKTACLLEMSASIGAVLADGDQKQVRMLGEFAGAMGHAFQIQDDLLDITSDERKLGKTFGSDVKRKKQTYLLIHALNHADADSRKRLRALLDDGEITHRHLMEVKNIFERTGSIKAARTTVDAYVSSAQRILDDLQTTHGKEFLQHFLHYISKRDA